LILHHNSTSSSFFNAVAIWNLKPYQANTSYSDLLKSIGLSSISSGSFYPRMNLQYHALYRKHCFTELRSSSKCWHFQYIAFISTTTDLIKKYWEAVKLTVANTRIPKFHFRLKTWILSSATNIVSCFFCRENVLIIQVCITILCQPFFQVKMVFH